MYPIAFHIAGYPVSSLGLCIALGSLFAAWRANGWLQRLGFPAGYVWHVFGWMMIAGVVGAKLWYAVEAVARGEAHFAAALFDRFGLTFYGGLIGGTMAIVLKGLFDGVPLNKLLSGFAPAVALGEAIGRIGCFLVGDDYGVPTSLPWGVAFPLGHPPTTERVHPTQLYESFWYFGVTIFLSRRVERSRSMFGEYLILEGVGRFTVEFIRTSPATLGPFTIFQLAAIVCVAAGACLIWRAGASDSRPDTGS